MHRVGLGCMGRLLHSKSDAQSGSRLRVFLLTKQLSGLLNNIRAAQV